MPALPTDLRNQPKSAIIAARREAEPGARKAPVSLAVDRRSPRPCQSGRSVVALHVGASWRRATA